MSQEPQKQSRFLLWIYLPLICPIIVGLTISYITGKIIIQITGVQFSIGLIVIVTAIIFVVQGVSFMLGMGYFVLGILSLFTKQKIPLVLRIAAKVAFPFMLLSNWVLEKIQEHL